MEASTPVLTISDKIANIRLNRPRYKNRLQPEDLIALREMLASLARNPEVRVLVITGTGDVFSAGFDLNALAAGNVGDARDGPDGFGAMVDAMEKLPQPTIARINGSLYGGATDLALACDFRIGITGIEAAMPAAKLGLHYYKSGILRYASRLGLDGAKRMFLTGERIAAAELLQIGFLTQLLEPGALDATVDALAASLAANAPMAVQGVKLALNEFARGEWNEAIFTARANAVLESDDLQEGIAAHLGRRVPQFKGG